MYVVGKCRLNKILKQKKLTQVDLAIEMNMSKQQIYKYANDEIVMSLKTLKNISHKLNVNMEDLYDFIWSDEQ